MSTKHNAISTSNSRLSAEHQQSEIVDWRTLFKFHSNSDSQITIIYLDVICVFNFVVDHRATRIGVCAFRQQQISEIMHNNSSESIKSRCEKVLANVQYNVQLQWRISNAAIRKYTADGRRQCLASRRFCFYFSVIRFAIKC